jgi:hypothetical protein
MNRKTGKKEIHFESSSSNDSSSDSSSSSGSSSLGEQI